MEKINNKYNFWKNSPGNINEHFDAIKQFSSECDIIVEMGIGRIISTWAFLAGSPKKLTSYDINHPQIYGPESNINEVVELANECGINYSFIQADTANIEIDECDLLFIDTLHTYDHLKKELEIHPKKVKKYIIFHDTVTFGSVGERPNTMGLLPAIYEFLQKSPEWKIKIHYLNNNGLLVLEKNHNPI